MSNIAAPFIFYLLKFWYTHSMKIKEIAFVCYGVKDIPKARKFYEGVLGMKPGSVWVGEGMGFVEYDLGKDGSHTFAIGKGAKNFRPGKEGGTAALEVDNFKEAVKILKKAKVKFVMKPHENKSCFMALVLDPSGNQLMIHKRK